MRNRLTDHGEFEQWIDQYVDRLTHLAYTYTRSWAAAEDAVQDAFLKAYQSRQQLQNPDSPFPWLARIVINQCRMVTRRTWREVLSDLLPSGVSPAAEDLLMVQEENSAVHTTILALPEPLRTPLYLFYFEDLPTKEIARIMGLSDGAVRIRLSRARDRFALELRRREEHGRRGETAAGQDSIPDSPGR